MKYKLKLLVLVFIIFGQLILQRVLILGIIKGILGGTVFYVKNWLYL